MLERLFHLKEYKTNVRTEVIAGVTTFFTMVYIIAVNPNILSLTGMDKQAVFVATILAAVVGTLMMSLYANVPYAQAAGMGLNAFFTYTVCFSLGFSWREALGLVFICGIINIVVTVTRIRKSLITAIPETLQKAIGGGIGLFISYMGLKSAGFIKFTADLGNYVIAEDSGTMIASGAIIPAIENFTERGAQLALIGLVITIILMVLKVKGAIFIGIIVTTLIGLPMGITQLPSSYVDMTSVGSLSLTFGQIFTKEGLPSLFSGGFSRILLVILTAFSFSLSDVFDTIGTFVGTGTASGLFSKKELEEFATSKKISTRLDKALFSDSIATSVGAIMGTSNVTTYVESAAGIAAGGRTGLTSLVISVLFLLCLPLAPLFGMVPSQATAPALIIVGILMMSSVKDIQWDDLEEAIPAFFTLVMMPFAYSITQGVAFGFITYCLIKIVRGKIKQIHPILGITTLLFIINFVMMGVKNL